MAFTVQRRGSYQGTDPKAAVKKTNWSDVNGVDDPDYEPYGSVDVDAHNRLVDFHKKLDELDDKIYPRRK